MSANDLISNFRNFLITSWPCLSNVLGILDWDRSPYFLDYWIQANWELLVEQQLLENDQFLRPYGYGASPGCRLIGKESITTHQFVCVRKGRKDSRKFVFLAFVASKGDGYKIEPPFDHVDVEDVLNGNRLTLPSIELEFSLEQA